ncbi:MAG: prepilin-type N-terminal cleavage/methylation domain-containing protein [Thiothrix sp.]
MSVCNNSASKGFSLLEVLVAFVVMGLVVGVILQLFGASMRSVALADEYSSAVQVAESQLAAVGSAIPVAAGSTNGVDPASGYHWEVQMTQVQPDEALEKVQVPLQLYQVEVRVSWQGATKMRELRLSSLRFGEK